MTSLSTELPPNATKNPKNYRSQPEIARKVIAFQELIGSEQARTSGREASALLGIPISSMRSWVKDQPKDNQELAVFLATPVGAEFLQRVVMAAHHSIHYGCGGIGSLQEFLGLSGLNQFVASSNGALQEFANRYEEHIIAFGEAQEAQSAKTMKRRKITAGLDEMFRKGCPCLVAIDVVSNFILLEKFTQDRKAETWTNELKPRLEELNVEVGQVVSDLCGGIRAAANQLGAEHIPELFHVQYEISKGTSAPLASQEREFERLVDEAEGALKKATEKYGEASEQAQEAKKTRDLRKHGLEKRQERRSEVKKANKELGQALHPIDLKTGKLQTPEEIQGRCEEQFSTIGTAVKAAGLAKSCQSRIEKARRAFMGIFKFIFMFFILYAAFIGELNLDIEQKLFFDEVIFPLCYLKMIIRRLSRAQRKEVQSLIDSLEARARDGPWSDELKKEWMKKGREIAESFQRSSSCVEGRNGMLSLYFHRFHRLNVRSIKALTIVHNFHIRRADKTTAAERFFGRKHDDLFESLVKHVRIPGKPRKQYHDLEKRQAGRLKRAIA